MSAAWTWQMEYDDDMPREVVGPSSSSAIAAVRDTPGNTAPRAGVYPRDVGTNPLRR